MKQKSHASKAKPEKTDPRVRRTRRALRDALVFLLLRKDYASITIREVTAQADVAYITFFRHFQTMDELLMEVLDEGLADLLARIETLAKQSEGAALETEGRLIFEYVDQRSDLFRILFKSQSVSRVRKSVVKSIVAIFNRECMPLARLKDTTAADIASNHIATSLMSLIEWWLDNKMKPSPVEMGKVYKNLIVMSTVKSVGSFAGTKLVS
jgi:AcrR family transcriptional regulator